MPVVAILTLIQAKITVCSRCGVGFHREHTARLNMQRQHARRSYALPAVDCTGRTWEFVVKSWANGSEQRRVYVLEQAALFLRSNQLHEIIYKAPHNQYLQFLNCVLFSLKIKPIWRKMPTT